jgi:hypothetical protein
VGGASCFEACVMILRKVGLSMADV